LDELFGHSPGDVDRHGETVARVDAGRAGDGGVDADHRSGQVYERSAGIAGVDRGVSLDEVLERRCGRLTGRGRLLRGLDDVQGSSGGAHDPRRHGELQPQWAAERQDPLALPQVVRVAERRGREATVNLEDGNVRGGVAGNDARLELAAIVERDGDSFGLPHDVV